MESYDCDVTRECGEISTVELKICDLEGFLNDLEADHEVYRIMRNFTCDEYLFGESLLPVERPEVQNTAMSCLQ
ncbi:hypothetical protein KIN20_033353 [Parelaphostrongylus tenuis]|uniref:Uncharacterized protein n=1 Tax=Parelaphostrongylus tenuis TaxID=148309 RepID=A0AAD5R8A5_PARTN|nr:hypothetical protein KIN20_033353 [Parelaphostrongylus tenuis]